MKIAETCDSWANMMASGGEICQKILADLDVEGCIDLDTEKKFFEELGSKGEPDNPENARVMSAIVIVDDQERFTCKGGDVPDGVFSKLFRLEDLKALRWRVPDCLKLLGIVDEELIEGLVEEELSSVTDEYDGTVHFGNSRGIVWVTDFGTVENLMDDIDGLTDRLGLTNFVDETKCVVCVYERGAIGLSLHVPRVFDGWGCMQFALVEDCSAKAGMTKPLNSTEQGLAEAVHRKCTVVPEQWFLRSI